LSISDRHLRLDRERLRPERGVLKSPSRLRAALLRSSGLLAGTRDDGAAICFKVFGRRRIGKHRESHDEPKIKLRRA
jgi:hypothetical protein